MTCRLFLSLFILGGAVSWPAVAQTSENPEMFSEESLRAVALLVIEDQRAISAAAESPPPPVRSYRRYWIVAGWLTAATVYDAEATFYLMDQCRECQEQNPMTRPIIEHGRLATYLYSAAVNAVVMYIARRMYDRADPWWRIVPLSLSIVHGIAGTWNLYQATHDPQT